MKKNKLYLTYALALLSLSSFAQTLINKAWQDTTGHPSVTYTLQTSETDGSGNVYIAGSTYHLGESDNLLIAKYSSSGTKLWQKEYDLLSYNSDILTDFYIKGNYYYLTGFIWDSVNARAAVLTAKGNTSNGDIVWTKTHNGSYGGYDGGSTVIADDAGNVYIGGMEQESAGNFRMLAIKYDSAGVQQWISYYDSSGYYDGAVGVSITSKSIAFTGFSGSAFSNWDFVTLTLNKNTGIAAGVSRSANASGGLSKPCSILKDYVENIYVAGTAAVSGSNTDIKIIKYDTLLTQLWVKKWGSSDSLAEEATSTCQDKEANLLITGYTTKNNGAKAMLVLKYNTSGSLLWSRSISAPDPTKNCTGEDIVADDSLNIYVTGSVSNGSDNDFVTASYDKNGTLRWYKTYDGGAGSNDNGFDIVVDSSQNVYVSGSSALASTRYVTLCYQQWYVPQVIVSDINNNPLYRAKELLIRFNPSLVNPAFVNNRDWQFANISDVIPDSVVNIMSAKTGVDFSKARIGKVFKQLTLADSLSITRDGDTITSPKFWATMIVYLPSGFSNSLLIVQDSLNLIPSIIFNTGKNLIVRNFSYPDDPYYPTTSGNYANSYNSLCDPVQGINICPLWDDGRFGDYSFRIGIFDGGVRFTHEEFVTAPLQSKAYEGHDFVTGQNNPNTDPTNHGTGVAGVAAGLTNNGLGGAGVAGGDIYGLSGTPGCAIINMKADNTLASRCEALVSGATYTPDSSKVGYEVFVANMSWGLMDTAMTQTDLKIVQDAIKWLYRNSVVCVAASGNDAGYISNYPASINAENLLIKVAGADSLGNGYTGFSTGPYVDVIAPCLETQLIVPSSTADDAYYGLTSGTSTLGTSYSAPLVSGVAGILQSYYYYITYSGGSGVVLYPDDVENLLEIYAKNNQSSNYGHGLIDAGNTYNHMKYPAYKIRHRVTAPQSSATVQKIDSNTSIKFIENYEKASDVVGSPHILLPAGVYTADIYKVGGVTVPFNLPAGETIINYWKNNSKTTLWREPQGIQNIVVPESDFNIISVTNADGEFEGYSYHITSGSSGAMDIWVPVDVSGSKFANGKVYYTLHTYNSSLDAISEITDANLALSVYPNPVSSSLSVLVKGVPSSCNEAAIYDITGKEIWKSTFRFTGEENHFSVNTSYFDQGVYIIIIKSKEVIHQAKFIICH